MVTETAEAQGLLTATASASSSPRSCRNFMGFTAMGIILIVMIGVGVPSSRGSSPR